MKTTISIIGLGLIGGSLGLALAPHHHILGYDPMKRFMEEALKKGAIHETATFEEAVRQANLLILAAPLGRLVELVEKCAPLMKEGALLLDVGSTKREVCHKMRELLPGRALGGHPMAGSEHVGIAHARAELFEGAAFALTPESPEEQKVAATVKELLKDLPVRWIELSAEEHDQTVAFTSHLPYLLSILAARMGQGAMKELPHLRDLLGPGFRDTTRLASQNPMMGRDLCLSNRESILLGLTQMRYILSQLEWLLENQNRNALAMILEETAAWRVGLYE